MEENELLRTEDVEQLDSSGFPLCLIMMFMRKWRSSLENRIELLLDFIDILKKAYQMVKFVPTKVITSICVRLHMLILFHVLRHDEEETMVLLEKFFPQWSEAYETEVKKSYLLKKSDRIARFRITVDKCRSLIISLVSEQEKKREFYDFYFKNDVKLFSDALDEDFTVVLRQFKSKLPLTFVEKVLGGNGFEYDSMEGKVKEFVDRLQELNTGSSSQSVLKEKLESFFLTVLSEMNGNGCAVTSVSNSQPAQSKQPVCVDGIMETMELCLDENVSMFHENWSEISTKSYDNQSELDLSNDGEMVIEQNEENDSDCHNTQEIITAMFSGDQVGKSTKDIMEMSFSSANSSIIDTETTILKGIEMVLQNDTTAGESSVLHTDGSIGFDVSDIQNDFVSKVAGTIVSSHVDLYPVQVFSLNDENVQIFA